MSEYNEFMRKLAEEMQRATFGENAHILTFTTDTQVEPVHAVVVSVKRRFDETNTPLPEEYTDMIVMDLSTIFQGMPQIIVKNISVEEARAFATALLTEALYIENSVKNNDS